MNKKAKKLIISLLASSVLLGLFGGCSNSDKKDVGSEQYVEQVTQDQSSEDEGVIITEENSTEADEELSNIESESEKSNKVTSNNAEIHFINTGNSDAILIKEDSGVNILIDAGDNDDESLMCSYLQKESIKKIDYLISTHPDADHCGGMDAVIDNFEIGTFFVGNGSSNTKTYTSVITSAANKGVSPSVPLEDKQIDLSDSSYMKFYNTVGGSNSNESSLVTLYVNGSDKFLFMGDAGIEAENKIVSKLCDVDVLKVGHHGSSTSTSQKLIDTTKPEYAVIQVGQNNKYGHPHRETMAILENESIEVHRNDECGDVIFKSTGNGVNTECKIGSYIANQKNNNQTVEQPQENTTSNNSNQTNTDTSQSNGEFVITQTGTKYHRPSCSTIKQVKDTVSREEAEALGYEACKRCNP